MKKIFGKATPSYLSPDGDAAGSCALESLLMSSSSNKTTIFVIGDSTAAEKGNFRN